jgi:hypothetical protein
VTVNNLTVLDFLLDHLALLADHLRKVGQGKGDLLKAWNFYADSPTASRRATALDEMKQVISTHAAELDVDLFALLVHVEKLVKANAWNEFYTARKCFIKPPVQNSGAPSRQRLALSFQRVAVYDDTSGDSTRSQRPTRFIIRRVPSEGE